MQYHGEVLFLVAASSDYMYNCFFVCVCFFSPFKLRKPSLYKYDLYRLLCLTAALLDCIFIMDSVIFQEVLCISLCLQHSTAFHMIVWFITVVIVFSLVVSARALHWLNTTWFPQEYCLSVSQLISSGCDDSQHVGLGYKRHYSVVFRKTGSCAGPVCAWSQEFAIDGGKEEFASHSQSECYAVLSPPPQLVDLLHAISIQGSRGI